MIGEPAVRLLSREVLTLLPGGTSAPATAPTALAAAEQQLASELEFTRAAFKSGVIGERLDADPFLRVFFSQRDQLLQYSATGTGFSPFHAPLGGILAFYEVRIHNCFQQVSSGMGSDFITMLDLLETAI